MEKCRNRQDITKDFPGAAPPATDELCEARKAQPLQTSRVPDPQHRPGFAAFGRVGLCSQAESAGGVQELPKCLQYWRSSFGHAERTAPSACVIAAQDRSECSSIVTPFPPLHTHTHQPRAHSGAPAACAPE